MTCWIRVSPIHIHFSEKKTYPQTHTCTQRREGMDSVEAETGGTPFYKPRNTKYWQQPPQPEETEPPERANSATNLISIAGLRTVGGCMSVIFATKFVVITAASGNCNRSSLGFFRTGQAHLVQVFTARYFLLNRIVSQLVVIYLFVWSIFIPHQNGSSKKMDSVGFWSLVKGKKASSD